MAVEQDATAGSSPATVDEDLVKSPAANEPEPAAEQETPAPNTTSPVEDAPAPEEKAPKPDPKAKAAPAPDPVQEAMDKLARKSKAPAPTKPDPKAPEAPAKAEAPKPEKKDPAAQAKDDRTLKDNPFAGLTGEETSSLKTKTQNRIQELHRRWRDAEDRAASAATQDPLSTEFSQIVNEHKLNEDLQFVPPEHLSGIVKVQAAINRSALAVQQGRRPSPQDVEMVAHTAKQVLGFAKQFGADVDQPSSAPQPFTGELPADLKDLVEVYGVDEKRVRLLAALEAGPQARTAAPAAPPAQPPAAQPAPQAAPQPEGVDMDALYAQRAMSSLVSEGVPADRVRAHLVALQPYQATEVQKRFPGVQAQQVPRVFNALAPAERFEITMAAHREMAKQSQVRSAHTTPQLPPPRVPAPSGGAPRKLAAAEDGDPVLAAMARLSRE